MAPGGQWPCLAHFLPWAEPGVLLDPLLAWACLWPVPESTSFLPAVLVRGGPGAGAVASGGGVCAPAHARRGPGRRLAAQSLRQGPRGRGLLVNVFAGLRLVLF